MSSYCHNFMIMFLLRLISFFSIFSACPSQVEKLPLFSILNWYCICRYCLHTFQQKSGKLQSIDDFAQSLNSNV